MSRLRVRPAVPADAPAYVAAHVAAQIATYGPILPPAYAQERVAEIPEATARLTEQLAEGQRLIAAGEEPFRRHWVAELDGHIVGIACSGDGPNDWELEFHPPPPDVSFMLDRIYVVPEALGSGAGQALFEAAVGDRSAYLWILNDNPRADQFYRRNGFRPDGSAGDTGPIWFYHPMYRMIRR